MMRMTMNCVLAAIVALLCVGCRGQNEPTKDGSGIYVYTDTDTGCQYVGWRPGYQAGGAITPRMGVDGKQICRKG